MPPAGALPTELEAELAQVETTPQTELLDLRAAVEDALDLVSRLAASRSVTGVRLGDWCVNATRGGASRFVEDVHHAVARGDLPSRFRPADAREACPRLGGPYVRRFPPKHRAGIPAAL